MLDVEHIEYQFLLMLEMRPSPGNHSVAQHKAVGLKKQSAIEGVSP